MRSGILTAAFAAGALAVPVVERDVVYTTDVVYATQYMTVTADAPAATSQVQSQVEAVAPAPEPTTSSKKHKHWGHKKPLQGGGGYTSYWSWATTWTEESAPAPTSEQQQQAPAYTDAPAPSSYEAPAPSSYEAPSSSAEPTKAAASASDSKPTDYPGFVIHHHNLHRANHSAPALEWDDELAQTAEAIGNTCRYEHNTYVDPFCSLLLTSHC